MANEVGSFNGVEIENIGAVNGVAPDNIATINETSFIITSGSIPDTPTNLQVNEGAMGLDVEAEWTASSGATSYNVKYSVNGGAEIDESVGSAISWYSDGYTSGDEICVRVAAINEYGTSAYTSISCVIVYGV